MGKTLKAFGRPLRKVSVGEYENDGVMLYLYGDGMWCAYVKYAPNQDLTATGGTPQEAVAALEKNAADLFRHLGNLLGYDVER